MVRDSAKKSIQKFAKNHLRRNTTARDAETHLQSCLQVASKFLKIEKFNFQASAPTAARLRNSGDNQSDHQAEMKTEKLTQIYFHIQKYNSLFPKNLTNCDKITEDKIWIKL